MGSLLKEDSDASASDRREFGLAVKLNGT